MYNLDETVREIIRQHLADKQQAKVYELLSDIISTIDATEYCALQPLTYGLLYLTTQIEEINKEDMNA